MSSIDFFTKETSTSSFILDVLSSVDNTVNVHTPTSDDAPEIAEALRAPLAPIVIWDLDSFSAKNAELLSRLREFSPDSMILAYAESPERYTEVSSKLYDTILSVEALRLHLMSKIARLKEIADHRRIAIVFVHHTRKKHDSKDGNNDVLEEEGVEDYDVFAAMGDSSESNILSCIMAKELGMKKTIAQVENLQFINEAENFNIGTIINKKLIASSTIFQMMIDDDTDNAKCLALADAEVAELEVGAGAKVTKALVKDLKLSRDMTIAGMVRSGVGQLVNGDTRLMAGDKVVIFCLSGAIHKIERMFG